MSDMVYVEWPVTGGGGNMAISERSAAPRVTTKEGTLFEDIRPAPDTLRAVKLTKENLRDVAAEILKATGEIYFTEDGIYPKAPPSDYVSPTFRVGDWVIEGYSYAKGEKRYRRATLKDRQKYDLR